MSHTSPHNILVSQVCVCDEARLEQGSLGKYQYAFVTPRTTRELNCMHVSIILKFSPRKSAWIIVRADFWKFFCGVQEVGRWWSCVAKGGNEPAVKTENCESRTPSFFGRKR